MVRLSQLHQHQTPTRVAPCRLLLMTMLCRRWFSLVLQLFLNRSLLTLTYHVGALIVSLNRSGADIWLFWVSEGVENCHSVVVIWVCVLLGLFSLDLLKVYLARVLFRTVKRCCYAIANSPSLCWFTTSWFTILLDMLRYAWFIHIPHLF